MPDNDLIRRSLDAGMEFTQMTRRRAEAIVRDLVRSGDVSREQTTARVEELLERSRQNTEALVKLVRREIDQRISALNLVSREDLGAWASRIGLPGAGKQAGTRKAAAKKATAGKAAAKKAPARKAPATTAKKAPARKAPARKAPAKTAKTAKAAKQA